MQRQIEEKDGKWSREFRLQFEEKGHKYTLLKKEGEPFEQELMSVTQIIQAAGLTPNYPRNEAGNFAMTRGSYVHEATEGFDKGILIEDELDPALQPYLNSWKDFRESFGVSDDNFVAIELPVFNRQFGYAGTIDRIMKIQFPGSHGTSKVVLADIKTGQPSDWHAIQTAGYALGYPDDYTILPCVTSDGGKPIHFNFTHGCMKDWPTHDSYWNESNGPPAFGPHREKIGEDFPLNKFIEGRMAVYLSPDGFTVENYNNKHDFNIFKSAALIASWKKGRKK